MADDIVVESRCVSNIVVCTERNLNERRGGREMVAYFIELIACIVDAKVRSVGDRWRQACVETMTENTINAERSRNKRNVGR